MTKNSKIERKTGIIVALDDERAESIASKIFEYVDAFKLGYPAVLKFGLKIISAISKYKPVIADFKIADIPPISSKIAELAFENKASAVICHAFVGSDSISEIVKVAKTYEGEVYAVSELSSPGGEQFMQPVSLSLVETALKSGCNGIVAPATRVERLKEISNFAKKINPNAKILSPGVGAQGGSAKEAIKFADFIIVGRSVCTGNPVENVKKLIELIDSEIK